MHIYIHTISKRHSPALRFHRQLRATHEFRPREKQRHFSRFSSSTSDLNHPLPPRISASKNYHSNYLSLRAHTNTRLNLANATGFTSETKRKSERSLGREKTLLHSCGTRLPFPPFAILSPIHHDNSVDSSECTRVLLPSSTPSIRQRRSRSETARASHPPPAHLRPATELAVP